MTRTHHSTTVARSLLAAVRSEQLTFLAAAIAYYAFLSTVPLALLGLAVASFVGGEQLARAVIGGVEGFLTAEAAGLLEVALTSDAGREWATVAGLAILTWSGLRVFRGFDVAFSRIYGVDAPERLLEQLRDAAVVLGGVALAVAVVAGAIAAVRLVGLPLADVLGPLPTVVALVAAFLPVFYVFPDRPMTVREALPGSVFAAVGWTLLAWFFALYSTVAGTYRLYGILGAAVLALSWFYAGGLLILLGGTLNAVLAGRVDNRHLQLESPRRAGQRDPMSDGEGSGDDGEDAAAVDTDDASPDGVETTDPDDGESETVADLRREVDALAADLEAKTVAREDLEADLRRYVRWRQRRGHARGWGPYLVLLYGTAMTLGAFYFLSGVWALLAMVVVWLSTLGLYVLMLLVGLAGATLGLPGRLVDRLRKLR